MGAGLSAFVCFFFQEEDGIGVLVRSRGLGDVYKRQVLVHQGWFWRGEDGRVTGIRRARLKALLENDLSLFAYHLPLDAHPEFGNNAQLARRLGWAVEGRFGEQDVGFLGRAEGSAQEIADRLALELGRLPLLVGDAGRRVERLAWCRGGAQGYFEQAIACLLYKSSAAAERSRVDPGGRRLI
mgnify:CR=1 FL=1